MKKEELAQWVIDNRYPKSEKEMKTSLTTILLFLSIGVMGQTAPSFKIGSGLKYNGDGKIERLDTAITNKWSSNNSNHYSLYEPKYPDTVKAGLMIANRRMTGKPRICVGTVIKHPDYTYTFFDHRMRLVDKKRILWAHQIPVIK